MTLPEAGPRLPPGPPAVGAAAVVEAVSHFLLTTLQGLCRCPPAAEEVLSAQNLTQLLAMLSRDQVSTACSLGVLRRVLIRVLAVAAGTACMQKELVAEIRDMHVVPVILHILQHGDDGSLDPRCAVDAGQLVVCLLRLSLRTSDALLNDFEAAEGTVLLIDRYRAIAERTDPATARMFLSSVFQLIFIGRTPPSMGGGGWDNPLQVVHGPGDARAALPAPAVHVVRSPSVFGCVLAALDTAAHRRDSSSADVPAVLLQRRELAVVDLLCTVFSVLGAERGNYAILADLQPCARLLTVLPLLSLRLKQYTFARIEALTATGHIGILSVPEARSYTLLFQDLRVDILALTGRHLCTMMRLSPAYRAVFREAGVLQAMLRFLHPPAMLLRVPPLAQFAHRPADIDAGLPRLPLADFVDVYQVAQFVRRAHGPDGTGDQGPGSAGGGAPLFAGGQGGADASFAAASAAASTAAASAGSSSSPSSSSSSGLQIPLLSPTRRGAAGRIGKLNTDAGLSPTRESWRVKAVAGLMVDRSEHGPDELPESLPRSSSGSHLASLGAATAPQAVPSALSLASREERLVVTVYALSNVLLELCLSLVTSCTGNQEQFLKLSGVRQLSSFFSDELLRPCALRIMETLAAAGDMVAIFIFLLFPFFC